LAVVRVVQKDRYRHQIWALKNIGIGPKEKTYWLSSD